MSNSWICGADIKGDFIPEIGVQFLNPGVGLAGCVKALSFQIVSGLVCYGQKEVRLILPCLKILDTLKVTLYLFKNLRRWLNFPFLKLSTAPVCCRFPSLTLHVLSSASQNATLSLPVRMLARSGAHGS